MHICKQECLFLSCLICLQCIRAATVLFAFWLGKAGQQLEGLKTGSTEGRVVGTMAGEGGV